MTPADMTPAESKALELVIRRLRRTYPDVPADAITEDVYTTYHGYRGARVMTYLPLLVERDVRDRLGTESPHRGPARDSSESATTSSSANPDSRAATSTPASGIESWSVVTPTKSSSP